MDKIKEQYNVQGAGMALTIAHDMLTQMNSTISAESTPEKGTSFYISFPIIES